MNTRIEKIGKTGYALRCTIHGLVANENDRSMIEHLQERHDSICPGPQAK